MTEFTKEMMDSLAEKLLFKLTDEENKTLLSEFSVIEENMNYINRIPDINKVEPLFYPFSLDSIKLRSDESASSLDVEDAFKNSGKVNGREVEVPRVVG